jgi:hypothetical protein
VPTLIQYIDYLYKEATDKLDEVDDKASKKYVWHKLLAGYITFPPKNVVAAAVVEACTPPLCIHERPAADATRQKLECGINQIL